MAGLFPSPLLFPGDIFPGDGFTAEILESLAPFLDANGDFQTYNMALASMFEDIYGLVADLGDPDEPGTYQPGWSVLLDPVNCPDQFLPYLGQFIGTFIAPGTDGTTARSLITAEQGFQRGTPAAIVAAAQRHLSGTQSCVLLERTPDAYSFVIVVRPSEDLDAVALTAAVNAVRPAGLTMQLIQTNGWTLFQMEAGFGSITALEAAFVTINGIDNDQAGS